MTRILYYIAIAGALIALIIVLSADLLGSATQTNDVLFAIAYAVIPLCLAIALDRAMHV